MLILIYNTMFGAAPYTVPLDLPPGFEFTTERRRLRDADAVVFHIPDLERIFLQRKRKGQLWVAWWMECPAHYRRLRSARFLRQFDLTMSYRQDADLMASYIPAALVYQTALPAPASRHQHLMCSFISGRQDRS
ncbi:MAG: hypothetical protein ACREO9_07080, partial [Lysobacterales bacterium]